MSSNLRDQVLLYAGRIAKWAQFSSNNGFGRGFMQGPEEDQALGEKPQPQPVRILQNFGFRSVLRQGAGEGVVIAPRGGPANAVAVAVDDQQLGPADLKEGESAQYCKAAGTRIWLDENGVIHVDAASGQDVIVNGGSAKVGRVGDGCGWLVIQYTATMAGLVVTAVYWSSTNPGLPPLGVIPPPPGTYQQELSITAGADHFKA